MTQEKPQLIIEWDRDWVRVLNTETNVVREAASLQSIESVGGKVAAISISRRLILFRTVVLPDAPKKESLIALKMKLAEIFPISASELAFDFIPTAERDHNGRACMVFAMQIKDIEDVLKACSDLNITAQKIVPAQASVFMLADRAMTADAIFAEKFGDLANIDVIKDSRLVTSKTVPVNQIETELIRAKALSPSAAVNLYQIPYDGSEQLLGGPLVQNFLSNNPELDLEPESYRLQKEKTARGRRHRVAYLLFAGGALAAVLTFNDLSTVGDQASKLQKRNKNIMKVAMLKSDEVKNDAAELEPKAVQLARAFQPAQKSSDIMKVANLLLPKDAWLTSLSLEKGKALQLRGTAKSNAAVSAYLRELTEQKRFRNVRLLFANQGDIEGTKVVQFSIEAFPVGNLPILEFGKQKKK